MAKIIHIGTGSTKKTETSFACTDEDLYRERIIDALSSLQSGKLKEAEAALQGLLTDVETVLAGGEI